MSSQMLPPHAGNGAGRNPLRGVLLTGGFIVFGLFYLLLVMLSAPLRLIGWLSGYR